METKCECNKLRQRVEQLEAQLSTYQALNREQAALLDTMHNRVMTALEENAKLAEKAKAKK